MQAGEADLSSDHRDKGIPMVTPHVASANPITALFVAALLASTGSAIAQPGVTANELEIVVEAPRSVSIPGERSPYTGAPIIVTTVRIPALYGDLDLAQPTDAARLMKRLDRVAHDACGQLDRLYPLNPDPDCVDRAVANATVTAKALIAVAQKRVSRKHRRHRQP